MIRELMPPESGLAFEAMLSLRGGVGGEESFVRRVDEIQRPEGYRLVAAFEDGDPAAVAAAGFRSGHSFAWATTSTSTEPGAAAAQ